MNKLNKYLLLIFLIITASCENSNITNKDRILVLIEKNISNKISEELNTYKNDLINEGFEVTFNYTDISKESDPIEIKEIIKKEFSKQKNIIGSVFIGNIQAPLFNNIKDQGDAYWHNYLADFYYMDLDGIWIDSDNNGILDEHIDTENKLWNKIKRKLGLSDNRKPEIWVSRIRADKLTSIGEEAELIKNYLTKNHDYRNNKIILPPKRAFSISAGVNFEKSDWGAYPEKIYKNIDKEVYHNKLGFSLRRFLSSKDGYEWGVINVFSGPRIHHFSHFFDEIDKELWNTKEGRKKIADYSDVISDSNDISWEDIKTIQPKVLFYHLVTSETGRHDNENYLGGMYIFSGLGLVAIAGTQHSGSVGMPILYDKLSHGFTFGDSWRQTLDWLVEHSEDQIRIAYYPNSELIINAGKSNYKAVLLGDGTLKLPSNNIK